MTQSKPITRSEWDALKEVLVDKTLSFGCEVLEKETGNYFIERYVGGVTMENSAAGCYQLENYDDLFDKDIYEILGHPILISNVLEKIQEFNQGLPWRLECRLECGELWRKCGFTKSLQQIVEESGWKYIALRDINKEEVPCAVSEGKDVALVLKSPEANALLSFLRDLFLNPESK